MGLRQTPSSGGPEEAVDVPLAPVARLPCTLSTQGPALLLQTLPKPHLSYLLLLRRI